MSSLPKSWPCHRPAALRDVGETWSETTRRQWLAWVSLEFHKLGHRCHPCFLAQWCEVDGKLAKQVLGHKVLLLPIDHASVVALVPRQAAGDIAGWTLEAHDDGCGLPGKLMSMARMDHVRRSCAHLRNGYHASLSGLSAT